MDNQDLEFKKIEKVVAKCNLDTDWDELYRKTVNLNQLNPSLHERQIGLVALIAYEVRRQ
jgi:hypothetical protein